MALVKCPECGQMVSDKATSCPNCGNPIRSTNGFNWRKTILPIAVLLLVAVGVFGAWHLLGNEKSNGNVEITDALSSAIRKYTAITEFHEGYAAVRRNDKWGYINSEGNEVIPCKYVGVSPFSEGLACVYLEDDNMPIEFIDKKGNTIISGYYGFAENGGMTYEPITFRNGVCCISDKEHNDVWIDKKGNKVDEPLNNDEVFVNDGTERFSEDGKVGVKDTLGNVLIKAKYSFVDNFSEGLALAYLYCGDETIYGYVDRNGKETFTSEDFAKFAQYTEQKQAEAIRAEEEQQRQTAEARLNGNEVLITMSADAHDDEFRNKQCNIGDISDRFDQLISKRLKVADGKVLIFKYAELDYNNMNLDFVRIFVFDKNGHQRTYEAMSCGEFPIFEGERVQALIHLNYGRGDNHLNAVFHFREKDRDMY